MKIFYGAIACIILSLVTSYIFPKFNLEIGAISTLYTVSGIMFSIGMSLIVTFNMSGVKNKDFKRIIRNRLHSIQNHFIACFILISTFYIILSPSLSTEINNWLVISKKNIVNYSQFLTYIVVYAIIYFITNFRLIERLNSELKDFVDKEEEKE